MKNRFVTFFAYALIALILGICWWQSTKVSETELDTGKGYEHTLAFKKITVDSNHNVTKLIVTKLNLENTQKNINQRQPPDFTKRLTLSKPIIATNDKPDLALPQSSGALWKQWKRLTTAQEYQHIPVINALLAEQLHNHPNQEIYRYIDGLLGQPVASVQNKALLLDLLTEIATPEALTLLIKMARLETSDPLYILVVQAISRIGENRWNGKFHEELSPILETAWLNHPNTDENFLNAIGSAIAEVGAPKGVNELLLTVSGETSPTVKDEIDKIKQEIAFHVIPKVRNPAAVSVLSRRLVQESLGKAPFELSGAALAEIPSPEATQALVNWAKVTPAEGARNAQEWLSKKIDDKKDLAMIKTAQSSEFQSPEVAAVMAGLTGAARSSLTSTLKVNEGETASLSVSPLSASSPKQ